MDNKNTFLAVFDFVLQDPKLTNSNQKLVLSLIYSHHRQSPIPHELNNSYFASRLGMDDRTASRAVQHLENLNYIEVKFLTHSQRFIKYIKDDPTNYKYTKESKNKVENLFNQNGTIDNLSIVNLSIDKKYQACDKMYKALDKMSQDSVQNVISYKNNNNYIKKDKSDSSSSFSKNNSSNKTDLYLPNYQSEEPQGKPQPLQSYLNKMIDSTSHFERAQELPEKPLNLSPEEDSLWNDQIVWGTQRLRTRELKISFKEVFIKYTAYCKENGKLPNKNGLKHLIETEWDEPPKSSEKKTEQKYNPRCSTPNADVAKELPEPRKLTEEEKKEREEEARRMDIGQYYATLFRENKDVFKKLGSFYHQFREKLVQANCMNEKLSIEETKNRLGL